MQALKVTLLSSHSRKFSLPPCELDRIETPKERHLDMTQKAG